MPRRSDFGLSAFKTSPLGQKIDPIITAPSKIEVMKQLALHGLPPVHALDDDLAHLVGEGVRAQEVNKHLGRWVYELIGMDTFETHGRVEIGGKAFESGATFRPRDKEPTIKRKHPRPGGDEFPIKSKYGYQLVSPDLEANLRTKVEYAVHTQRLSEALKLIRKGYNIRMGRKGVRPSLIAEESLTIME